MCKVNTLVTVKLPYPPFTDHGHIWRLKLNLWCALTCQISGWSIYIVASEEPQTPAFDRIVSAFWGGAT